jgi:hypothetical protein
MHGCHPAPHLHWCQGVALAQRLGIVLWLSFERLASLVLKRQQPSAVTLRIGADAPVGREFSREWQGVFAATRTVRVGLRRVFPALNVTERLVVLRVASRQFEQRLVSLAHVYPITASASQRICSTSVASRLICP